MTRQEISDLFDEYEDGYQAWRGNGVMTKGAFIEAVTEALRIHDVSNSLNFDKGYEQGYNDATREACQEIAKNYQPNDR